MQQDEAFHAIQLNGKQLVFLFMAATVVVVVIFLCGVMVGRGVPVQRAASVVDTTEQGTVDPTKPAQPSPTATASGSNTPGPIPSEKDITYWDRLEDPTPPQERLRQAVNREEPVLERPEPAEAVEAPKTPVPPNYKFQEPAGRGFVVQVAAVRKRAEAETIAQRLRTRGYPSFVTTSGANYRVRVGKYDNRGTAEDTAERLASQEHFRPWITR